MNEIFFGLKRAYQATLRLTRPWLTRLGLTAARFDLLSALSAGPRGTLQSELRRSLGVTAPTVSRMVRSLEKLGFVRRHRSTVDRRLLHVVLTEIGRRVIRRATRFIIESGAAQLAVDCALCGPRWFEDDECFGQMCDAEYLLSKIREAFGDTAKHFYPWHPDD